MVSIQLDIVKFLLIYRHLQNDYRFKRGVSPAARSTIERPSHCPDCRNEQQRKPHVGVNIQHCQHLPTGHKMPEANEGFIYKSTFGAFPVALSLTILKSLRSSSIVKTKAYKNAFYHMYVCPTSAHRGFRYGYRRHKGNNFISESVLFC